MAPAGDHPEAAAPITTGADRIPRGRRTMADTAADQLHEMILSGSMPAGHHLRLASLAEELGMSPMPVREAIRRLASLGLVEVHPHRGAFVRGLTEDDLQDTLETRLILEIAAIQRAAEIFSEAHYSEAEALLERHQALLQAGLVVEAREAHTQFHFTLYRASRLRWLVSAIEPVFRNSERYRFLAAGTRPEAEARAEHHAILDACAARKPQEAAEALSVHLKGASERMLVNLQASGLASQDTDIDEDTEL